MELVIVIAPVIISGIISYIMVERKYKFALSLQEMINKNKSDIKEYDIMLNKMKSELELGLKKQVDETERMKSELELQLKKQVDETERMKSELELQLKKQVDETERMKSELELEKAKINAKSGTDMAMFSNPQMIGLFSEILKNPELLKTLSDFSK